MGIDAITIAARRSLALAGRGEAWGLQLVPEEALAVTAGVDVQHDRLEATFLGWSETGVSFVLGHRVLWGQWDAAETWEGLDDLLRLRFPHAPYAAADHGDQGCARKPPDDRTRGLED